MGAPRDRHDSGTSGGDVPLQERLERLGRIVVTEIEAWEQATRTQRRQAIDTLAKSIGSEIEAALGKAAQKAQERHARRYEERIARKAARRKERQEREEQNASVPGGVVMLLVALGCGLFAALRPELWWLIFVALGMGLGGVQQVAAAGRRRRKEKLERRAHAAELEPEHVPAAAHPVDESCDALLADLKVAPDAVRSFVQNPEATVESLRKTAKALDARRAQLLEEVPPERFEKLAAQRKELEVRRDGMIDAHAKKRLDDALASLEQQEASLNTLKVAAERVDGEYTSLLVLLQELRTRVAVARTAGSEVQLEGLKASVGRLNDELGAITDAMQAVQAGTLAPVVDVGSEADATPEPQRERT